jgi:Holliday junction resolvasome RuvABC endonuclease subunit
MIYIGLDLATWKTGCCVMDSGGNLIHYELIMIKKTAEKRRENDFRKRISEIGDIVQDIIKKYKPQILALEEPPIIKNSSASMLLVMHGYFLKIANIHDLDYRVYQPNYWRSVLGILGNNGKDALKKDEIKKATVNFVNEKYNTDFLYIKDSDKSTDDIADSIGVALCAIAEGE